VQENKDEQSVILAIECAKTVYNDDGLWNDWTNSYEPWNSWSKNWLSGKNRGRKPARKLAYALEINYTSMFYDYYYHYSLIAKPQIKKQNMNRVLAAFCAVQAAVELGVKEEESKVWLYGFAWCVTSAIKYSRNI